MLGVLFCAAYFRLTTWELCGCISILYHCLWEWINSSYYRKLCQCLFPLFSNDSLCPRIISCGQKKIGNIAVNNLGVSCLLEQICSQDIVFLFDAKSFGIMPLVVMLELTARNWFLLPILPFRCHQILYEVLDEITYLFPNISRSVSDRLWECISNFIHTWLACDYLSSCN